MGDLIEGIGNEVLGTLLVSAFLYIFIMLNVWRGFNAFYRRGRDFINARYGAEDLQEDDALLRSFQDRRGENGNGPNETPHFNTGNCPICLGPQQLPIETNCGHLFCGICIQSYYDHGGFRSSPMRCPLCRQMINMFFLCFTEAETVDTNSEVAVPRRNIVALVRFYNMQYSGEPRSLLSYFADWPTLMRHLWHEFFTNGGLLNAFRLRVVVCTLTAFVYLISPLDVIPEGVFGILGLIDDIVVLLLVGVYLSIVYRRLVLARTD